MSGGGEGGKILGGGGGGGRSSSPVCSFVSVTGKSTLLGSCIVGATLEGLGKSGWNVLSVVDETVLPMEGDEEEVPAVMPVEEDGAMRDGGKGNPDGLLPVEPTEGARDE